MTKKHKLEEAFGGHQKLYARILEILGSAPDAEISIFNLDISKKHAYAKICMKFCKTDLPKNFVKKSRDHLRFSLYFPDYSLALSDIALGGDDRCIQNISETDIAILCEPYVFSFSCKNIVFGGFEASNFYKLVDNNYGVNLDDLIGDKWPTKPTTPRSYRRRSVSMVKTKNGPRPLMG